MQPQPYIVTVIEEPKKETTYGDVLVAAFGVTGVLVLIALVLGGVLSLLLIRWHRRHPPELGHLPSITSAVPDPDARPSSPAP
ncbi:MAG TPA: hypothetical protein VES67_11070 [Vicinamibacterales bacterium]|nr:hypothetical protein [Vicinamibacterales bacterium]